jgi:hypothetical protein
LVSTDNLAGHPGYRESVRDAHQVIAQHLEGFLRAVAEAGDGAGLPQFVEREFPPALSSVEGTCRIATPPWTVHLLVPRRS